MNKFVRKKIIYLLIMIIILFPFSLFSIYSYKNNNQNNSNILFVKANDDPDIDLSDLPQINYNSIIYDWYNPKIEMLIIVPPFLSNNLDWVEAVKPLAEWKNQKGVKTVILNSTAGFSGSDPAEKIRNMIKHYYETENVRWVLLCGDAQDDLIPIRYVYNPDLIRYGQGKTESLGDDYYKPTDFYYAELTGNWDLDEDEDWGEKASDNSFNRDEVDWTPEVYVGRFPASDLDQLKVMVNKTLNYETNPEVGDWMNRMLLAGGVSDPKSSDDDDGEDESRLTNYIIQNYINPTMNYTHLANWVSFEPPYPKYDLSSTSFETNFNNGFSTVIFAGHGDFNIYSDIIDGSIYSSGQANTCTNINKIALIYADACATTSYDHNDDNIGEILITKENAGAIGYIGGLRLTWYLTNDYNLEKLNRANAKLFWEEFYMNKKFQQGRALYDSKIAYLESDYIQNMPNALSYDYQRKQLLTYSLLGDPDIDIYTNIPINASNPFNDKVYTSQLVSTTIRDKNGTAVPYARVHLRTTDGIYHTVYADINGIVNFRLPPYIGKTYNVTITGHNLIPSYFNFTTIPDFITPEINEEGFEPKKPTVSDKISFNTEVYDFQSGLEKVYLIKSNKDDFKRYDYYKMFDSLQDNEDNLYEYKIDKLDPGTYYFAIVARDWANNYHILYDDDFEINIPVPLTDFILIVSSIIIIGVVGVSSVFVYLEYKNYMFTQWRMKRKY